MSNECESESCSTESCESSSSKCGCGSDCCGGDPIECGIGMWHGSFFQALKAAQVDALKAKIQKAWGAKLDKAADAVLEAMGAQWQAALVKGQAESQLREKLSALWQQEGRK